MKLTGPRELFAIDLRSMAAFRVGLALVVLFDLAVRLPDLGAHYTDAGIIPRSFLPDGGWRFGIHTWFADVPGQLALFALTAVVAASLLVGFQSRCSAALAWFLTISLQNRNPMVGEGADQMLRVFLFWSMFLPIGARWSIDAVRARGATLPKRVASTATIAVLAQIVFVYVFAGLHKSHAAWTEHGHALHMALSLDMFTTPLGQHLRELPPDVLRFGTFATRWFELLGPFLLFVPIGTTACRYLAVAGFMVLHLAIGFAFEIGWFPWIGVVVWTLCLPSVFWDKLALWRISSRLQRAVHHVWRRHVYRADAPNRRDGVRLRPRFATNVLLLFLPIYVACWNVSGLPEASIRLHGLTWIGEASGLEQCWNMFSPMPYTDDGWYVLDATLANGSRVDLMPFAIADEAPRQRVTFDKPFHVAAEYGSSRWQKYMSHLWLEQGDRHRRRFAAWLAAKWNDAHSPDEAIHRLRIWYVLERYDRDRPPTPRPRRIWDTRPPREPRITRSAPNPLPPRRASYAADRIARMRRSTSRAG